MTRFARLQGRAVRSGGAEGADECFESAYRLDVYLPWRNFRRKTGTWDYSPRQLEFADSVLREAFPYALTKSTTKALFRRNVWQVIGLCQCLKDVKPSDFVVCWTPDGATCLDEYNIQTTGGTGVAINVASLFNVPVCNLQLEDHRAQVFDYCRKVERRLKLSFDYNSGRHYCKRTKQWMTAPAILELKGA